MTPLDQQYRMIPLTQGQVALVDVADFDMLATFKWCAHWCPSSRTYRAMRRGWISIDDQEVVYMHRQILGLRKGDKALVDHINGNGIDNRRCNLRLADQASNAWNCGKRPDNKSGYKGVSWDSARRKWIAVITAHKQRYHLGYFDSPEAAYAVYCVSAKKYHGEFARVK